MSTITYKVTPSYDFDTKELHIVTTSRFQEIENELIHQVISLQEKSVRDALIKLGWTPPNWEDSL